MRQTHKPNADEVMPIQQKQHATVLTILAPIIAPAAGDEGSIASVTSSLEGAI